MLVKTLKQVRDMDKTFKKVTDMLQKETGVAGGVFAVFRDGEVIYKNKFGMADKEEGREMTYTCSFDIASCSKAWTVMLLAQAVDEGLVKWDQPIKEVFPDFGMGDEYASNHASIRDLASHRTGFAYHDFLREKVGTSRRYLTKKTALLPNEWDFRTEYHYNNHMFIVLGDLLEHLYGKRWEELCVEKIAKPLGIKDVRFRGNKGNMDNLERALPYACDGYKTFRCGYADNPFSGPCGGIKISLPEFLKWAMAMAKGGVCEDGTRLCSEEQFKQIIEPAIPSTEENGFGILGSTYCMAWHRAVYRGVDVVYHSGGLSGFNTQVGFLPGKNEGYALIVNSGSNPTSDMLKHMALDYIIDGKPADNYDDMFAAWAKRRDAARAKLAAGFDGTPITAATDPGLVGTFFHPGYEDFSIEERDGQLWFLYGDFQAKLVRSAADGEIVGFTGVMDGMEPDRVDLKVNGNDLLLRHSASSIWFPFVRQ